MANSIHFELMNWCSLEILEIYEAENVFVCIYVYMLFFIFCTESWQRQIVSIPHHDINFSGMMTTSLLNITQQPVYIIYVKMGKQLYTAKGCLFCCTPPHKVTLIIYNHCSTKFCRLRILMIYAICKLHSYICLITSAKYCRDFQDSSPNNGHQWTCPIG